MKCSKFEALVETLSERISTSFAGILTERQQERVLELILEKTVDLRADADELIAEYKLRNDFV